MDNNYSSHKLFVIFNFPLDNNFTDMSNSISKFFYTVKFFPIRLTVGSFKNLNNFKEILKIRLMIKLWICFFKIIYKKYSRKLLDLNIFSNYFEVSQNFSTIPSIFLWNSCIISLSFLRSSSNFCFQIFLDPFLKLGT